MAQPIQTKDRQTKGALKKGGEGALKKGGGEGPNRKAKFPKESSKRGGSGGGGGHALLGTSKSLIYRTKVALLAKLSQERTM